MGGRALLVNQPKTAGQNRFLRGYASGRVLFGLDRVVYPSAWDVPVEGMVAFRMGSRSARHALGFLRELKSLGITDAVIFHEDGMMAGRGPLTLLLLMAGVGVTGVLPSGETRGAGLRETLTGAAADFMAMPGVRRPEVSGRLWFAARLARARLGGRRRRATVPAGRLRVLHVTRTAGIGGIASVVYQLIKCTDKGRYEPSLLALDEGGAAAEAVRKMGVRVDVLGVYRWSYAFVRALTGYIDSAGVDVLHYHGGQIESVPVRLAALFAGVPVVIFHAHGTFTPKTEGSWSVGSYRRDALAATDRVVAVSGQVKDYHVSEFGYPVEMVSVVYNGVDTEVFRPGADRDAAKSRFGIPSGCGTVCIIGRISHEKGHYTLMKALALLDASRQWRCLVVGDGPLSGEVAALADSLGVGGRVDFLGFREDVADVLEAVDVFVQPSITEGFPVAVIEAMAMGVPVVATPVGGVPEAVQDGVTGILVPPEDPASLAGAIGMLLADDGLASRIGSAASARARERFGMGRFLKGMSDIYEECIEGLAGGRE